MVALLYATIDSQSGISMNPGFWVLRIVQTRMSCTSILHKLATASFTSLSPVERVSYVLPSPWTSNFIAGKGGNAATKRVGFSSINKFTVNHFCRAFFSKKRGTDTGTGDALVRGDNLEVTSGKKEDYSLRHKVTAVRSNGLRRWESWVQGIDEDYWSSTPFCFLEGNLDSGLYLVATPIGNLEDITLRALHVLKLADLILSEDTRHSRKLLQYHNIHTPLMSYHKFNESFRQATILQRLQQGQIIALISDAGSPGISDPGAKIAKVCIDQKFPVIPIPGPSAVVTALTASGLPTAEFSFVGFLPIQSNTRRKRLMAAANEAATQIFYVPPHKLHQFLEESISIFGESRCCVIAREMTKLHEEFWRGTLAQAKNEFSQRNPRGEITLLIQGQEIHHADAPSETELESELQYLVLSGHSISEAVKLVSERMNIKRKLVYAIALKMHESRCKLENRDQDEDMHMSD